MSYRLGAAHDNRTDFMTTEKLETETADPFSSMPWFCVLWSAAEVGLVWWAVTTEATGPSNIVKLMAVWNTIGGIALAYAAATEEKKDPRPTWLKRFLNVADFGLVLILAWWGWWWCALGFMWGAIASAGYRDRKGKTQNDKNQTPPPMA